MDRTGNTRPPPPHHGSPEFVVEVFFAAGPAGYLDHYVRRLPFFPDQVVLAIALFDALDHQHVRRHMPPPMPGR